MRGGHAREKRGSLARENRHETAEKLFELSPNHPVGLMTFGSASFMGVPWEVVFTLFSEHLGSRTFPVLSDYRDEFVTFVRQHPLFTPEVQLDGLRTQLHYYIGSQLAGFLTEPAEPENLATAFAGTPSRIAPQSVEAVLEQISSDLDGLRSFRLRVDAHETESVGGSIDVAVISKRDGFTWVRRRRCFDVKLNPARWES